MDDLHSGRVSKVRLTFLSLFLAFSIPAVGGMTAPQNLVTRAGDRSIVLHWENSTDLTFSGYRVYRSLAKTGPFSPTASNLLTSPSFADLSVTNGRNYFY